MKYFIGRLAFYLYPEKKTVWHDILKELIPEMLDGFAVSLLSACRYTCKINTCDGESILCSTIMM